jgi:hypothetical protein
MRSLLFVPLVAIAAFATAQDKVMVPKPGTKMRSAILDGIRPKFLKETGLKAVKMKVMKIWAYKDYAFVHFMPLQPNGKDIDWKKTKYKEPFEQGMFDAGTAVLVHLEGKVWKVKEMAVGPTDVAWEPWPEKYKLPRKMFGMPHHW